MGNLKHILDISDYLVTFVRVAVTGVPENVSLPQNFDWEALYTLSEKQKLCAVTFRGIQLVGLTVPKPLFDKWYVRTQQVLSKSIRFEYELSQIISAFEQAEIDFVLVKGVTLQNYWPEKGLREFSDHDILVRDSSRERACDVLLSLGYSNELHDGFVDVYKKEPIYDVEIHIRLFEEHHSYAVYFDDIWNRVIPVDGSQHQYQFTLIDFYLYFLFHFIKHTQNNGNGLRFYADLFILQEKLFFSSEEQQHVSLVISKYDVCKSVESMFHKVDCLFRRKDQLSAQEKEFIFSGNAYGGHTQTIYNSMQKDGTKRYVLNRLFPSRKALLRKYTILESFPFMLPFVWIYRLVHHLFTGYHRKRIVREIRNVKRFSGKEVE
ncbi:MAG: nucleotidyltransferase family protein [Clostridia bacterium]|nr:nucleotidyltransferase family protein [Clostridia bacterium]